MLQAQDTPPLSALEHRILDTLRASSERWMTIGELALRSHLPEGTVRFSLQWLLACRLVQYERERYHLYNQASAD